jgi:hypothetical protein
MTSSHSGCVLPQVGATPCGTELPRCVHDQDMRARMQGMAEAHRPVLPCGPGERRRTLPTVLGSSWRSQLFSRPVRGLLGLPRGT